MLTKLFIYLCGRVKLKLGMKINHSMSSSPSLSEPLLSLSLSEFSEDPLFRLVQSLHLQRPVHAKFALKHEHRFEEQPVLQEQSTFSKTPSGAEGRSIQSMLTFVPLSTNHPWCVISGYSTTGCRALCQMAA